MWREYKEMHEPNSLSQLPRREKVEQRSTGRSAFCLPLRGSRQTQLSQVFTPLESLKCH